MIVLVLAYEHEPRYRAPYIWELFERLISGFFNTLVKAAVPGR